MAAGLADAIQHCTLCPLSSLREGLAVPARLGRDAKAPLLAVMGEAPGAQEDATGQPFVGKAGRILDGLLRSVGLDRESVLLINRVRCRPPNNDIKSHPEAVEACDFWTKAELAAYNPKVVVLVGATAIGSIFGGGAGVGELRGHVRATGEDFEYGARLWVPTYHPASLLPFRRPENTPLVVADLLLAKSLLEG